MTSTETERLDELETDPHVNLAYYDMKSREYVFEVVKGMITGDRIDIGEVRRVEGEAL